MVEYIGYLGSLLVAVSLLMSNVYKLRIINLIGAVIFVIYGYIIGANAVWAVNLFVAFVDAYYIIQLKTKTELFRFVQMKYNEMVKDFIDFHYKDIISYFPDFENRKREEINYYLIVRNFVVVGVFGYTSYPDFFKIEIDYIARDWRDLQNAINFFKHISRAPDFRGKKFLIETTNETHISYLKKIGFKPSSENKFEYVI